jgi:hypothetical protein
MYNVFDHYRSLHYLSCVSLKDTTTSAPLVRKEHSGDFGNMEIERVSRVGSRRVNVQYIWRCFGIEEYTKLAARAVL